MATTTTERVPRHRRNGILVPYASYSIVIQSVSLGGMFCCQYHKLRLAFLHQVQVGRDVSCSILPPIVYEVGHAFVVQFIVQFLPKDTSIVGQLVSTIYFHTDQGTNYLKILIE